MKSRVDVAFVFSLSPTTVGQIVTVGNGIVDIKAGLSVNPIFTGFSCQLITMSRIDEPHKYVDIKTATIHQTLLGRNHF